MADKPVTREEKYLAYLTGDYKGELPKPITRKEKYLYELCLKGIGGEISPEEVKAAVNEYLEKNPVKPGATTEQAQQIEQNKTDIGSLKTETGSLKEDLGDLYGTDSNNILNSSKYTPNKIKLITGEVRDSDVYDMFELLVETGVTYNFGCDVRAIVIYDGDNIVQTAEYVRTITAENTKAYVSIQKANSANYKMFKDGVDDNTVSNFGEKNLKGELAERLDSAESRLDSVILHNENMLCGSEFKENYNFNSSVAPSTSYNLFTNIPVKSGVHYTISPKARIVIITEKTVQNDGDTGNILERINTGEGITEHTPTHDGYMQLTVYKNDSDYLLYTDDAENVYPSNETHLSDSVVIPSEYPTKEQVKEIIAAKANDMLFGKKWIHCGDSFSWGSESAILTEGKYAGRNKVFPFIIGNRTSIEVVDTFFRSGMTLAFPENPGSFSNSITCPTAQCYYQNIPDDADYITVYLGINDGHHDTGNSGTDGEVTEGYIGLGTIDDNTTATYYGAWNEVLSWLLEHRPFAHIGIIVSNGVNDNSWRLAQIEIAKKYGIPYIDLNGDERTPVMIRSVNPDVSQTVKTVVNRKQAVDPDGIGGFVNLHPNDYAHEYESTFIESFLRNI
jgi:hypothetical protein